MRVLILTRGQHTVVDDDVYEWASKFKWQAHSAGHGSKKFYAARSIRESGKNKTILLHREILHSAFEVDHKDGDSLNNLKENLRAATHAQNSKNRIKAIKNTSGFIGVSFHRRIKKWQAYISARPIVCLGYFETVLEAARARDLAAQKLYGDFARLNFPKAAA